MITGLLLLAAGMLFGLAGALQYIVPGFMKQYLSFERIRPLHVSSVIFWIIFGSTGAVLAFFRQHSGREIYSARLAKIQLFIFLFTVAAIMVSYCAGIFGGREYWEFHPVLALPIVAGWILFLLNIFRSIDTLRKQPVYVWMWLTGIVFFLFTFLESYLWIFPYFRNNVVNDMTVQWKSYGSMVGSWNMLIYGSSIFLMQKISGDKKHAHSPAAFALYFTGLFNLMFNWGHHIYTLPTHAYVKHVSYVVSMTELIILGRIIYTWKDAVSTAARHFHQVAYRFLLAADAWIFLTLMLAILMSVPAINVYTHGTHVTVAHAMGSTIGINSFLLLAAAFDMLHDTCTPIMKFRKRLQAGYWIANISLFIFWISLIGAGMLKAKWQMSSVQVPFSVMMLQLRPFFISIFLSGATMATGFLLIIYPLVKNPLACYFGQAGKKERTSQQYTTENLAVE